MLTDILKSKMFNVIFSVALGIGLVCLFRSQCKGDDCKQIKAPPITEWDGMTYRMGAKCYTYNSEIIDCPAEGAIESFENQFRNRESAINRRF
jgi:hypothetical protein